MRLRLRRPALRARGRGGEWGEEEAAVEGVETTTSTSMRSTLLSLSLLQVRRRRGSASAAGVDKERTAGCLEPLRSSVRARQSSGKAGFF